MKKFLVVIDMQNDFVDGALSTPEAAEIVPAVVKKINEFEGEIIITFDTHFDDYLDSTEGKRLPIPHCIINSHGWQLNPEVAAALSGRPYAHIHKITFGCVTLAMQIQEAAKGEKHFSIDIIGLYSDVCIVTNALLLKSFFPDAQITVDSACTAGMTPEGHAAALLTMRNCHIDII